MITYAKNAKIYSNGNVQQYETYYNHKLSECLDAILVHPTTQPVDENANRKYGWDICLINTQVGPIEGNLIIANIETIKEKNKKKSFTANGYKFQIHKDEDGGYTLFSPDIIADKFNIDAILKYINAEEK